MTAASSSDTLPSGRPILAGSELEPPRKYRCLGHKGRVSAVVQGGDVLVSHHVTGETVTFPHVGEYDLVFDEVSEEGCLVQNMDDGDTRVDIFSESFTKILGEDAHGNLYVRGRGEQACD